MKYMKRVALEGAHNFRDLGGIPVGSAKSTRWGCLYRSDSLAGLTASDWKELTERNIQTVIDLRSENETKASPILLQEEMDYHHYNLMKELDRQVHGAERSKESIVKSMQLDYVETVFGNMKCCADILRGISDGLNKGAVVFLCSAGKDRTGITAAMVLYIAGAENQDIIADYMISSTLNTDGINRLMKNFPVPEEYLTAIPDLMERVKKVLDSRPETMEALLEAFEARNFRGCLEVCGFTEEMQKELADIITE